MITIRELIVIGGCLTFDWRLAIGHFIPPYLRHGSVIRVGSLQDVRPYGTSHKSASLQDMSLVASQDFASSQDVLSTGLHRTLCRHKTYIATRLHRNLHRHKICPSRLHRNSPVTRCCVPTGLRPPTKKPAHNFSWAGTHLT
jgi:hypothetical protein